MPMKCVPASELQKSMRFTISYEGELGLKSLEKEILKKAVVCSNGSQTAHSKLGSKVCEYYMSN